MNRIRTIVIAGMSALIVANTAYALSSSGPRYVAFKGADTAQTMVYHVTERVIDGANMPAPTPTPTPSVKVAKRSVVYKPVAAPTALIVKRKPECRLHALAMGGSPSSPFVSVCE
jgi:hypothetical protein